MWALVPTGGAAGTGGKDRESAYEIVKRLNPEVGSEEEWIASLKGKDGKNGANGKDGAAGAKGDPGTPGAAGKDCTNGKDCKYITAIKLIKDENGGITSGTVTFSDDSTLPITIGGQESAYSFSNISA